MEPHLKFEHYKNNKINCPIEYAASKSGVISITKILAKFMVEKKLGQRISPGGIKDNQPKIFEEI